MLDPRIKAPCYRYNAALAAIMQAAIERRPICERNLAHEIVQYGAPPMDLCDAAALGVVSHVSAFDLFTNREECHRAFGVACCAGRGAAARYLLVHSCIDFVPAARSIIHGGHHVVAKYLALMCIAPMLSCCDDAALAAELLRIVRGRSLSSYTIKYACQYNDGMSVLDRLVRNGAILHEDHVMACILLNNSDVLRRLIELNVRYDLYSAIRQACWHRSAASLDTLLKYNRHHGVDTLRRIIKNVPNLDAAMLEQLLSHLRLAV